MCRKLKAKEIECRVAQVSAKGCSLLLYKTARVDRAILTETYGDLWQNDYKTIDGKMYGGIGIYNKELKEWIWRWDVGVESNTEAVKGESSDAFKRSAFRFGIGIELYSAPFIWINCETEQYNGKYKLKDKFAKFDVKEIGYAENGDIDKLVITDSKGNTVYELGKYIKPQDFEQPLTKEEEQNLDSELADLDIMNGVDAVSDMKNLEIYYNENKDKVTNIKMFNKKVNARKEQLKES